MDGHNLVVIGWLDMEVKPGIKVVILPGPVGNVADVAVESFVKRGFLAQGLQFCVQTVDPATVIYTKVEGPAFLGIEERA